MILLALFILAFASTPCLSHLILHHIVTRRPVLQKVRHHARVALCLLVSKRFQVLFHSPPGVLFTVPSRYCSLSVTWSYLALWDGPHVFRQDSSCPDVLRILPAFCKFRLRDFHPRFGLLRFRSPLLSESFLLSFPPGTKMFQFPGFPPQHYGFMSRSCNIVARSSLIRISADLGIFASPRSFSQLVTSFFGAMYLGILLLLFVA